MPDYSVVIPAFNEEKYIAQTLGNLLSAMQKINDFKGEVLVVDNNSSDQTASIAKSQKVKVVFEPINQISRARNTGARSARGKFLVFLDADTQISFELLNIALKSLKSSKVGGGGATLVFDENQNHYFLGVLMPRLWSWISKKFKLAAGSFIFCDSKLFQKVGGFSENLFAGEEILFSVNYKKECKKKGLDFLIFENYPVITSARKLSWFSSMQIFFFILLPMVFPLALRFRTFCSFWYRRPNE